MKIISYSMEIQSYKAFTFTMMRLCVCNENIFLGSKQSRLLHISHFFAILHYFCFIGLAIGFTYFIFMVTFKMNLNNILFYRLCKSWQNNLDRSRVIINIKFHILRQCLDKNWFIFQGSVSTCFLLRNLYCTKMFHVILKQIYTYSETPL